MLPSALLLPTERPPSSRDVKRALLTFETVHLCSPDDRELIPPNTYMTIVTGSPPIFGIPVAAVRPLGKVPKYDEAFQRLLDECKAASEQGSLVVRPAPVYQKELTIGATPIPDGIPDPLTTYFSFRAMAAQPDFVAAVSRGLDDIPSLATVDVAALAPGGADDSNTTLYINGAVAGSPHPPFSLYPGFASTDDERILLTRICLARLGSLSRNLLACEDAGLSPFTSDSGLAAAIQKLESNLPSAFDEFLGENDQRTSLRRLQWLEKVVITEFVDLDALDRMSVREVLRLRTKAWGNGNEARASLSNALRNIALDSETPEKFKEAASSTISKYIKDSEDLRHELKKLVTSAACDIGIRTCQAGGLVEAAEHLQKFLVTGSPAAAIVFGGLYHVFKFAKENAPVCLDLARKHDELHGSAGYSLFRTYESFPRRT